MPERNNLGNNPNLSTNEHGNLLMSWNVQEYNQHQRRPGWYVWMIILGIVMMIYAIWTFNFLFAVIIILVGVIIYLTTNSKPGRVKISVWEDGVELGDTFYPFKTIKKFWIIYEPPEVKNLYFEVDRVLRPEVSIELGKTNPIKLRGLLLDYLEEDLEQEDESANDFLGRKLKI
ncbi:hypothetical protein KKC88_03250 [Patescibacteria group bacterium]|nr:hypothetical protein [Patescibacteria group bacterium]